MRKYISYGAHFTRGKLKRIMIKEQDAARLADTLRTLEAPIHAFFEATMVMSDNEDERYARLSVVKAAAEVLLLGGDFSKLEG